MEITELLTILKEGESSTIEFKESLSGDIDKVACAFANTKGGRILIGVKDSGEPIGLDNDKNFKQEISDKLQRLRPMPQIEIGEFPIVTKKIVTIEVKESSNLVSVSNTVYIRVGTNNYPLSIEEIIEKSAESRRVFFDQTKTDIPASELSKELLIKYLKVRERIRGVRYNDELYETAVQLKILHKKNKALFLTNAGILCFTEEPQKYIGNSTVRLTRFEDNEMKNYSDQREFSGPLQVIVENIEKYLLTNLNRVGGFTVGFKRQEFLEYPIQALREAIINAVIHRNYFDAAEIRIFIFPDKIEIRNPGSFPPGVSVDNPEHKPRNPEIAQFFYDLGLTDKYGSGIIKIIKEVEEHPFVGVLFTPKPYSTTVTFTKALNRIDLDSINIKILEVLSISPSSSGELAKSIGLSKTSTIDRLKSLRTLGFIKQEGEGPKTVYILSKTLV